MQEVHNLQLPETISCQILNLRTLRFILHYSTLYLFLNLSFCDSQIMHPDGQKLKKTLFLTNDVVMVMNCLTILRDY